VGIISTRRSAYAVSSEAFSVHFRPAEDVVHGGPKGCLGVRPEIKVALAWSLCARFASSAVLRQ
jgi:hypothetical protein